MKLFVYCLREFDEKAYFDYYTKQYHMTYTYTTAYPSLENIGLAEGCQAVSLTPCRITDEMLYRFYEVGVRYIACRSIGFDHINLALAKELGMCVSHVAYAPETVADYAIMMMLMGCRRMGHIMMRSMVQDYTLKGKMGVDIGQCVIGVIGTGSIGSTVIRHLSGFGCRILACDPYPKKELEGFAEYVSFEKLLQESDVITLHAPASKENYHLLDENAFSKMKQGVMLVNTARGTLIDTDALIEALKAGKVAHAALDVLEYETGLYYMNRMGDCIDNHQMAVLRSFPNVLLTPHTAFYTDTVVASMAENVIKTAYDMAEGNDNPLILLS